MASKRYTIYTCDVCGQEVTKAHSGCVEEWRAFHVDSEGNENFVTVDLDFDLCDDCFEKIMALVDVMKAEVSV